MSISSAQADIRVELQGFMKSNKEDMEWIPVKI